MLPPLGPEMGCEPKRREVTQVRIGHQGHVAAVAAVAAVGPAAGNVLLTAETDAAVAAASASHLDCRAVCEHRSASLRCYAVSACTLMYRLPLRRANSTVPSTVANTVS